MNVVDMEESAAAEAEAMMEAQAQAAALIDTLQGDMHTCGRCQEIVLEVNMAPATSGEFRNSWLCRNEEACIARATAGGRGARVRRKRKEFECYRGGPCGRARSSVRSVNCRFAARPPMIP